MSQAVALRHQLYVVLDHVRELFRDRIEASAQVCRYLGGHHARVDDTHIRAIVEPQPAIDDAAEVAPHHRACRDGVRHGVEVVPDPAAPVRVRAAVGVVRHAAEPRA